MKKVNLRDCYPDLYHEDSYIEIPEEVSEAILESERHENAYQRKLYRYRAYFSLDREDGIENDVLHSAPPPDEICEQEAVLDALCMAIDGLSEIQARRIRAYFREQRAKRTCWHVHLATAANQIQSIWFPGYEHGGDRLCGGRQQEPDIPFH